MSNLRYGLYHYGKYRYAGSVVIDSGGGDVRCCAKAE